MARVSSLSSAGLLEFSPVRSWGLVSLLVFHMCILIPRRRSKDHHLLKCFWDTQKGERCTTRVLIEAYGFYALLLLPPSWYLKHDRAKAPSLPVGWIFSKVWREVAYEWWKLRVLIMWNSFIQFWCGEAGSTGNKHSSYCILQELSQCFEGVSLEWCLSQKCSSHEEGVLISLLFGVVCSTVPWGCCCSQGFSLLPKVFCFAWERDWERLWTVSFFT